MEVGLEMGQAFTAILSACLIGSLSHRAALAQIIPDTTWGAENSIVTTNGTVQGQPVTLIEGGAVRSTNLFHSFQTLNVSDGQRVYFANPAGIQTILSRVTGNTASNILGTLGVDGAANLFLINPSGILFGPDARLDVNGSFVATTANEIQFGNQGFFAVANSQAPPLLTINPSALWFTQATAQAIINRSTADAVGLRAAPDRSLLLVGGQVQLEGGRIVAPGGRVELAGVAEGQIGLQFNNNQWRLIPNQVDRADVSLTNNAQVNVRSGGGGDIIVNAKNFSMTGAGTQLLAGVNPGLGSLETQAGNIEINATASTNLDASLLDNSVLGNAIGNGGSIQVKTDSLLLTNGAQFSTNLLGRGNLGDITVDARRMTLDEIGSKDRGGLLSVVAQGAEGNSSNISVTTDLLTVKNGAELSTTLRGRGKAGNITITVSNTASFSGLSRATRLTSGVFSNVSASTAVGNAGKITINTGSLFLRDGAAVRTRMLGRGNAGDIIINARDLVVLEGIKPPPGAVVGGLSSVVFDGAIGNSGDITITTGSFFARNGAAIGTSSSGQGNAGNVTILAREAAVLDGTESRGFPSAIFTAVERLPPESGFVGNAAGNGGKVTIIAKDVSVTNGARIQAGIDDAPGQAGSIIINAERVTLAGTSLRFGNSSGLFTNTVGDTTATGGEIRVSADTLHILEGALLSAASQGSGRGGNIYIGVDALKLRTGGQLLTTAAGLGQAGDILVTARDRILIEGNDPTFLVRNIAQLARGGIFISAGPFSGVFANTEVTSPGQGGTIALQTGTLRVQNSGRISVASQGSGAAGQIDIAARSIQLRDQGRITAETASSTGGNINLMVQDVLLLRRNSLISTTAGTVGAGGDGGNIRIDARFLVTNSSEGSDITANAFSGRGGRVEIEALGLFGFIPRSRLNLELALQTTDPDRLNPQRLPTSDITAISQASPLLSGSVTINTPNLDPTQALANLPEVPIDVSGLINQQLCAVAQGSQFIVTGRGGLPDSPTSTLNPSAVWEDWRITESTRRTATISAEVQRQEHQPAPVVEAQGWMKAANGSILLVAPATVTSGAAEQIAPQSPWFTAPNCHSISPIPHPTIAPLTKSATLPDL